jgi:lipid A 3-O-deacylase
VRVIVASVALLTGLAVGGEVHRQAMAQAASTSLELRGGVLAHDVPDLWAGFSLEGGIDINGELLFGRGLPFLGGTLRPAVGVSVNTEGYTSRGYIDARWEIEVGRIFIGVGLGAALHDGQLDASQPDRKALGSRVLFHIPLELGFRLDERSSISIFFEHMSNANLADANEGLDALGVRYGYRF